MNTRDRSVLKAVLASIGCHFCWGLSFLASRTGLNEASVFVLLSHRFMIAFLLLHCFPRRVAGLKQARRELPMLLALGLAQPVIYFLSEQYGILHSTTGFSGVMIAMIPVVTTLAAAPILGERPSRGQLLFSLLSVGGVVGLGLMNGSSGRLDWIGIAALTAAVLAGSAYSLLARGISRRTTPFDRTYAMVGLGALVFTVPALISCGGDFEVYLRPFGRTPYLLSVLFLSAFGSVLSFFLSNYAISKLPLARETVFANLTTAVSVFAGVLILHEPFSWLSLACILLILIGIWGVQRADRRAADETKHEKQEVLT